MLDFSSLDEFKNDCTKVLEEMKTDKECFQELEKCLFIRYSSIVYKIRNCSLIMRIFKNDDLKKELSTYLKI